MAMLEIGEITPWAAHASTTPRTGHRDGRLVIAANGTRICSGGWLIDYPGAEAGRWYRMRQAVQTTGLAQPRDALECVAIWGQPPEDGVIRGADWDYLLPVPAGDGAFRFERQLRAPADAERLVLRCTFRWSATGESVWELPQVELMEEAPPARPPVRVSVVTGSDDGRRARRFTTIEDNMRFYSELCEAACAESPQLIVLPEICLQWGLPNHPTENAVAVPGPETEVFSEIAARHGTRICVGLHERNGDAVHNSAILIGPTGEIDGRYRKVHLAVGGESTNGVLPGDGFPVFETEIGRIGCNICMDSSAAESSRMVGLNGADFLLLPIMGDHRASRWSRGMPLFNESRWIAIMRTRAMDNQLCMVVARNNVQGSCIIDRKGDILAWNEGSEPYIVADVVYEDGFRTWNGGCFRDINWLQRRPHIYGPFVDPENVGSLR